MDLVCGPSPLSGPSKQVFGTGAAIQELPTCETCRSNEARYLLRRLIPQRTRIFPPTILFANLHEPSCSEENLPRLPWALSMSVRSHLFILLDRLLATWLPDGDCHRQHFFSVRSMDGCCEQLSDAYWCRSCKIIAVMSPLHNYHRTPRTQLERVDCLLQRPDSRGIIPLSSLCGTGKEVSFSSPVEIIISPPSQRPVSRFTTAQITLLFFFAPL